MKIKLLWQLPTFKGEIKLNDKSITDISFKMRFLMDVLNKKSELLKQIYNITENQELFERTMTGEDRDTLLREAVNEKQKIIEEVIAADNTFMKVFGEFKGELNRNQDRFRTEIKQMQNKIREVSDIDFKIRAKENRAKQGVQVRPSVLSKKIKTLKSSKNYILDKYRKNTSST